MKLQSAIRMTFATIFTLALIALLFILPSAIASPSHSSSLSPSPAASPFPPLPHHPFPLSSKFRRYEWRHAHRVLRDDHLLTHHFSWTGRVGYYHKNSNNICVEVLNPYPSKDLHFGYHLVNAGGFLKVCRNGQFRFHDGIPFHHMHTW